MNDPVSEKDSADQLRANCALGLVRCATVMEALTLFADLLVDPCALARIGAARAIAATGRWEGVPLLRLRVRSGESNAEVIGVCCAALLELAPDENWELVLGFLHHVTDDVRVQAALALGESHLPQAFVALRDAWGSDWDPSVRSAMLTCIGLLRSAESRDFLVSLIRGENVTDAVDAVRALAPYRSMDELVQQVARAVEESTNSRLRRVFADEFRIDVREC